ncbi:MAG: hypothetical protein Q8Q94_02825 [bacterium]|nr:hypothetical protein [bacterium]MDZ4299917.1 hypothetical protein [Candidatus Sungbacteria bacterium]
MKNALLAIGITTLVVAGYAVFLSARLGSGMRLTLPSPDEFATPVAPTLTRSPLVSPPQKKSPPQQAALPAVPTPTERSAVSVATTTEIAVPNGIPQ